VNGLNLGEWVYTQRTEWKRKQKQNGNDESWLTDERERLLNDLSFAWSARNKLWDNNFCALAEYRKESKGSTPVPTAYKTEGGLKLGVWVSTQRKTLKKVKSDDDIGKERVRLLTALDFVWDAREAKWLDHYHELVKFQEMFGHTRVPMAYKVNGLKLGIWVNNQRTEWKRKQNSKKDSWLTVERVRLVNNLCFVWEPRG
jgi:hypothetical protein